MEVFPLQESDPEVKKASVLTTEVRNVAPFPDHFETSRLDGTSSWYQPMKVIALCLRPKSRFHRREFKKPGKPGTRSSAEDEKSVQKFTVPELQEAEKTIIKCLQYEHFQTELQVLCDLNVTDGVTNRSQARAKPKVTKEQFVVQIGSVHGPRWSYSCWRSYQKSRCTR